MRTPTPGHSLAEHNPELLEEWSEKNIVTPSEVSYGSNSKKYWWTCPNGHEDYLATCNNRTKRHNSTGCPECGEISFKNTRNTPTLEKSLGYLYPDIASSWSFNNNRTPFQVYPHANKVKYKWVCEYCGEEYKMICSDRSRGYGCTPCGYARATKIQTLPPPFHSFGDLYPDLLKEYSKENPTNPYALYPNSASCGPITWICSVCDYEWKTYLYCRTSGHTGCPNHTTWGTSWAEEELRKTLGFFGASQEKQTKLGKWNVDIYIPESKTVVEYDGSYFHSRYNKYSVDRRKSLDLLESGYRVLRVRTHSGNNILDTLSIEHREYFEVFYEEPKKISDVDKLALQILSVL